MNRIPIKHSLLGKILGLFILIVAIPAVIGGGSAVKMFLDILLEKSSGSYEVSVQNLHDQLQKELFETKMSAYYIYLDLDLKHAFSVYEEDPISSAKTKDFLTTKFGNYHISPNFSNVNTIKVYGFNGLNMSFGDQVFSGAIDDQWVLNSPLYQEALDKPESFIWSGIHQDEEGPGIAGSISLFRVIKDRAYSDGIAMLYVNLDSKLFSTLVNSRNNTEDSQLYVLDSTNTSVGEHPIPSFVLDTVRAHHEPMRTDYTITYDIGKEKRLFVHYLSDFQWKIVGVLEVSSLAQSSFDLVGYFVIGFVIFLIIASLVWLAVVTYLLAPIGRLQAATRRVHDGDFSVQVPLGTKDEIGELSRDFNYMVGKIDQLLHEQVAQTRAQKNAEYKALQAQINPHFLYNTLNSIRWMAILQKADNIKKVVETLGRLLRNSTRKMDQFIKIEEELANLTDYVQIELVAYTNRFEVNYDIEDRVLSYQCFKFLLQPLVENAIFHGVLPKQGFGTIDIKSALVVDSHLGSCVEFEVTDDGVGMSAHNKEMEPNSEQHYGYKFNSIGLSSVLERLKICYPDKHYFNIDSEKDSFTRITVRIPALGEEECLKS